MICAFFEMDPGTVDTSKKSGGKEVMPREAFTLRSGVHAQEP